MDIKPFPKNRKLSNAERFRIFTCDIPAIEKYAKAQGFGLDEAKRRFVHIAAQIIELSLESDPNGNRSRYDLSLALLNQRAA